MADKVFADSKGRLLRVAVDERGFVTFDPPGREIRTPDVTATGKVGQLIRHLEQLAPAPRGAAGEEAERLRAALTNLCDWVEATDTDGSIYVADSLAKARAALSPAAPTEGRRDG